MRTTHCPLAASRDGRSSGSRLLGSRFRGRCRATHVAWRKSASEEPAISSPPARRSFAGPSHADSPALDDRAAAGRLAPWRQPAAASGTGVMGQEAGLLTIERFLDQVAEGRSTLVLDGEVGAGKTTLWRAVVAAA